MVSCYTIALNILSITRKSRKMVNGAEFQVLEFIMVSFFFNLFSTRVASPTPSQDMAPGTKRKAVAIDEVDESLPIKRRRTVKANAAREEVTEPKVAERIAIHPRARAVPSAKKASVTNSKSVKQAPTEKSAAVLAAEEASLQWARMQIFKKQVDTETSSREMDKRWNDDFLFSPDDQDTDIVGTMRNTDRWIKEWASKWLPRHWSWDMIQTTDRRKIQSWALFS